LIVAGGIASEEEVSELDRLGVDAVVGMAIYSGKFLITQD
jgi:phosphoribosylformimino-5-aminoimidazole carboxamide ribotide isomerase